MIIRNGSFVMILVSIGLLSILPYLFLSGSPSGEAARSNPKAVISIMAYNSSGDVLYDYAGRMDFAGIEALADANSSRPIPEEDLLEALPGPLPGWLYLIWGSTSMSNSTYSSALGMFSKGTMPALEEIAYVAIGSKVGGYDLGFDPKTVEVVLGVDDGYPKEVTIQGYPGIEWRSTGENLGETTQWEGNLESFGALMVGIGGTIHIPETGLLIILVSVLFLGTQSRKRTSRAKVDSVLPFGSYPMGS